MSDIKVLPVEFVLNIYRNDELVHIGNYQVGESTESLGSIEAIEGRKKLLVHYEKERDPVFMSKCKENYSLKDPSMKCEICGFSFLENYGEIGRGFIEGHHKKPIYELSKETIIRSDDIVMVCSNCHSMIHSKYPCYSVEEIKHIIKHPK